MADTTPAGDRMFWDVRFWFCSNPIKFTQIELNLPQIFFAG